MHPAVPIVYAPTGPARRLGPAGRLGALLTAAACLAVLLVGASLPPSGRGVGTHQALGLQRCAFLDRMGLPCPTCGMTTSFAWFARGNLAASLYVQPMGAILAALAACGVWVGAYAAATARPVHHLLRTAPSHYYLLSLLALGVLGWAWKIFIHLRRIDGW